MINRIMPNGHSIWRLAFAGLIAVAISFNSHASAQNVEKIPFDDGSGTISTASGNSYYLAVRPVSNQIRGTLLMIASFNSAEDLLPETRLHNVASANDLLTVYVSMGRKLDADTAAVARINAVVRSVVAKYSVDTGRCVLAGFSFAGNIALRYTELANQYPSMCMMHPKAVFAVDTPVDLFGLWHWSEREIRKNYFPGSVGDARTLLDIMTKENGSITANPEAYRHLTPFHEEDSATGNEQYLADTPVRLYYDTDIEWQLANRRNSYYDTDIADGSELISRLLQHGNTAAQFVSSKKPGVRSNGARNPGSLSIVDEVDCIQWIKNALDIFDPIAWTPPYVFPVLKGWDTERFAVPPGFAPTFTWKGVEELRFHPGWADPASPGYWSYAYLWWIDGALSVDESALHHNLQALYSGLVGRNIVSGNIPASKLIPTSASVKKTTTMKADLATFHGSVRMLDYMTQKPMMLNLLIHVKSARMDMSGRTPAKSAVLVEASPQPLEQAVWRELDAMADGFVAP
jgi:hypothetical protein